MHQTVAFGSEVCALIPGILQNSQKYIILLSKQMGFVN